MWACCFHSPAACRSRSIFRPERPKCSSEYVSYSFPATSNSFFTARDEFLLHHTSHQTTRNGEVHFNHHHGHTSSNRGSSESLRYCGVAGDDPRANRFSRSAPLLASQQELSRCRQRLDSPAAPYGVVGYREPQSTLTSKFCWAYRARMLTIPPGHAHPSQLPTPLQGAEQSQFLQYAPLTLLRRQRRRPRQGTPSPIPRL